RESFGKGVVMNIHPDSIYMGALGAALFALDDLRTGRRLAQPRFLEAKPAAAPQPAAKRAASPLKIAQPPHHHEAPPSAALIDLPAERGERVLTAGVDVGASAVKVAIVEADGGGRRGIASVVQRHRKRARRQ